MKKSIEIYALVVCFFALVWFTVTFGFLLNQLVRITFPQLSVPVSNYYNPVNQTVSTPVPGASREKTKDQMQVAWEANYKLALEQERRDAIRRIIHDLIGLIVSALLFIPHWKLARMEKLSR